MGDAGVLAQDGSLAAELAAALEPRLQDALNHPTRRDVLRALHAEGGPRTVSEILDELSPLTRGEVSYHAQVLTDTCCVEVEGTRPTPSGSERLLRSTVTRSDQALLVLRATRQPDRKHRQRVIDANSPGSLAMFRIPRRGVTVRLLNRRRERMERNR